MTYLEKRPGGDEKLIKKLILSTICALTLVPAPGWSVIYSWRDEGGVMHYTNDERDVPLQYRKANNLEVYKWLDEKSGEIRYTVAKEDVPPQYRKQAGIDVFRYTDSKANVHYAFNLEDVPKQYRDKAVKETEEALSSAVVDTAKAPTQQPPAAQANPFVEALRTYQRYKDAEKQQPAQGPEKTNPFIEAIKRSQRLRQQQQGR